MNSNSFFKTNSITKAIAIFAVAFGAFVTFAANKPGYDVKPSSFVPAWSGASPCEWTMDYEQALANAETEGKYTLMMFSGMWWCPHCQALEEKVLATDSFRDFVASNGFYLVALDFPYRDGYSNNCWLWDEDYRRTYCGGMTAEDGTNTVYRRYEVQNAYSTPGAARQSVVLYGEDGLTPTGTVEYARVGYPTMLVLKPNGSVAGRFSVSKTFASLDYVTNRIEQLLAADEADEADDYWQGATALDEPDCEEAVVTNGVHTFSLVDKVDWYRLDVTGGGGNLWRFKFSDGGRRFSSLAVGLYADPAGSALASKVLEEVDGSFSAIIATNGTYYLKVTPQETPETVIGYALSYDYITSPAEVKFASTNVEVASSAKSAVLKVSIEKADLNAEVIVDWCAIDATATNGVDYAGETGSLIWKVGERKVAKQIEVPLLDPGVWKGDRRFFVQLSPRRHCDVPSVVSECCVTIKESRTRRPGKLAFDTALKTETVKLRENQPYDIVVYRTDGADGVVTGFVSVVENRVTTVKDEMLVWNHGDSEPKTFVYVPANQVGIQEPQVATISLKAAAGGRTGTPNVLKCERYDELMDQPFAAYNKTVLSSAASVNGDFWFYGAEESGGASVLRSSNLGAKGTDLSFRCKGPGVLLCDVGLRGGAMATLSLEKIPLERDLVEDGHFALAIPAGQKTVALSVAGGGNTNAFATLSWNFHPFTENKLTCLYPYAKSTLRISEVDWLVMSNPGSCSDFAGLPVRVEFFAGATSSKMMPLNADGVDHTLVEGDNKAVVCAQERETLAGILEPLLGKTVSWRGDVVYVDAYGNRAVQTGTVSSFNLASAAAPRLDIAGTLPTGCSVDAPVRTISLPDQTVGVEAKIGPLPLTGVPLGGEVAVSAKNGSLPAGVKLLSAADGIWLVGVPTKAGAFAFDVLPTVKTVAGRKTETVGGATVRLVVNVHELGAVAATFEGYRVAEDERGAAIALRGTASMTVTAKGGITGKVVLNGTNVSFRATSFTSLNDKAFRVDGQLVKVGSASLPISLALELGEREDKYCDAKLLIGDAEFWLFRNDWKSAEGKELLKAVTGYYTAALPVIASDPAEAPTGVGYLMATIKNTGVVTYSGMDSLGKSFSGTSAIWHVPDCCNLSGVRWVFYVSAKTGGSNVTGSGLSGLVLVEPNESDPSIRYLSLADDGGMQLVNLTPKSIGAFSAWTNSLNVVGGSYDTARPLSVADSWQQTMAFPLPTDYDGSKGTSGYLLRSSPEGVLLRVSESGKVEFAADEWNSKFATFAPATGLFGAKFSLFYDSESAKTKSRTVSVKGVWIQNSTYGHPFWSGFFGLPDKGVSIDSRGKTSSYSVTVTYPFVLE